MALKPVGWKIPEPLRRRLNSHSEYLSVKNDTPTEMMVAEWLGERIEIEERKRALRKLEIEEKDLPEKPVRDELANENGEGQLGDLPRQMLGKSQQKTSDIPDARKTPRKNAP
jgi:DNA-directed RNA polymerase subunit H (RpoH/RPB5)